MARRRKRSRALDNAEYVIGVEEDGTAIEVPGELGRLISGYVASMDTAFEEKARTEISTPQQALAALHAIANELLQPVGNKYRFERGHNIRRAAQLLEKSIK
jgi:hypothetical protein